VSKKKSSELNQTYIVIAVIIGLAILGYGYLNFQAKQNELGVKQNQLDAESQKTALYQGCAREAEKSATDLLKSKAEMAKGTYTYTTLKNAVDKNMYLKPDYDYAFNSCLTRYGLKPLN
jgi:type II secretory pathway pseudopilin PulG